MQARAILEAAVEAEKKEGEPVHLEIMVPLVATKRELDLIRERIERIADAVRSETGGDPRYMIGTMIELPRAAHCAPATSRNRPSSSASAPTT